MKANIKIILFVIVAVMAYCSNVLALPIIDGMLDFNEGYSTGYYVTLSVQGAGTISEKAQLWWHQDSASKDVFVAFQQPRALIDNTYGANAIGWDPKHHKLKDLKGSDKAQFVFYDGLGNRVLDVFLDYFSSDRSAPSEYNSLGVTRGDGRVNFGDEAMVKKWGTSLAYNFNTLGYVLTTDSPATDSNYTENPSYAGWLFDVIYEIQIDGSLFNANGFGDVFVPFVHDSPNKKGKNLITTDGRELILPPIIPEPSSFTLLGAGLLGLLRLIRRRK